MQTSTLHDRLIEIHPRGINPMDYFLQGLEGETRALLLHLMANPNISTRSIHEALKAEGTHISRETITTYRKSLHVAS